LATTTNGLGASMPQHLVHGSSTSTQVAHIPIKENRSTIYFWPCATHF
jgi:hypothetical protein